MLRRLAAYAAYEDATENENELMLRNMGIEPHGVGYVRVGHASLLRQPSSQACLRVIDDVRAALGAGATSAQSARSLLAVLERGLYMLDGRTKTTTRDGTSVLTTFAVSSPRGDLVTFHTESDSYTGNQASMGSVLNAHLVGVADEATAGDGLREALGIAQRGLGGLGLARWIEDTLLERVDDYMQPVCHSSRYESLPFDFAEGKREAKLLHRSVGTQDPVSGGGQMFFEYKEPRAATACTLLESLGLEAVHPDDLLLALLVISRMVPASEAGEHWTTPPTFGSQKNVPLQLRTPLVHYPPNPIPAQSARRRQTSRQSNEIPAHYNLV
ncbi:hypothetical protein T492DRAFT_1142048 [Pavlovales sp. CCMP2436]|nr:hypothetical protein T492DRAFT_1142048 [Pavlovales sp. CCMP2436]